MPAVRVDRTACPFLGAAMMFADVLGYDVGLLKGAPGQESLTPKVGGPEPRLPESPKVGGSQNFSKMFGPPADLMSYQSKCSEAG